MRMADAARDGEVDVPRHLAAAARLAREARVDDLRGEIEAVRSAAGGSLDPDDEVFAGTLLAAARYNAGQPAPARRELDRVCTALPQATPVRQGRFHSIAGIIAHGDGDDDRAIAELLRALAVLDGEQEPTEDLAIVLGNCAASLAHTQMFTLGVETGERAVAVAAKAGAPTGRFRFQAGEAALTWAIRLEHLRMSNEAADQWHAAIGHYTATMPYLDELGALFGAQAYARLGLCLARTDRPAQARQNLDAANRLPRQAVHETRRMLEHVSGAVLLAERRYAEAASVLALAWPAVRQLHRPPWTEDVAYLLARAAEQTGNVTVALRWYREVHERYGRREYEVAVAREAVARLRVEQETLLRRSRQLETDARSDPLTGVANRRSLDETLAERAACCGAGGQPTTVVVLDIDGFKQINDERGHPVGDEVLRRVAVILRRHLRDGDLCARYGGDEFVLVLAVPAAEAAAVADRAAGEIARHSWSEVAPGLSITVTSGLAELAGDDPPGNAFAAADRSLLEAKRDRRRAGTANSRRTQTLSRR
jgi:diguanylate cyclase (GGDEF)-like protein